MLCERCQVRPASVHITRIVNGQKQNQHLCTECADELGLMPDELGFPGFLEFPDIFSSLLRRRPADRMYESFSESTQKVMHFAQEEAKRLSHDHVTPEHLLLGIVKEAGIAGKVLEALGVKPVELFSDIESLIGRGEQPSPESLTLSPRAKKVLELAYQTARELGFNYVGSEHILLGILKEAESIAAQALTKRKVTFDKAVKEIISEIEKAIPSSATPEIDMMPEEMFGLPGMGMAQPTSLSNFSRDLTALAKEGKLDPVIDREKEIDRLMRVLSRRTKNNPALLGDPGVGKTAIVEGLAERIVKGDVPEVLKDKQVVSLDLTGLIAGTKYRGEFEARVKKILDEIIAKGRQIILFIDELHTLVGAGAAEGAIDAANILKPALARGELQCIGATTVDEYRKYIEKDAALERRFQPIMVEQPSVELTIEILKGIRDKYEAHHRVKIPDDVLVSAVTLADRYITDRFLPDKAIDLMDEAGAKIRLKMITPPKELREAKKELEQLKKEKEAALTGQQYEKAAGFRDKQEALEKKIKTLEENWEPEKAKELTVTPEDIAEIVSDWTGIPVIKLTEEETSRLLKMEEALHKRIVGQEEAIDAIAAAIRRGRAGLKAPERPLGSFIFAGPTGVGKTEVARRLAEFLFGSIDMMIRIDMSEYMEKHTVSRLFGAPPGYVGYEEGGMLTEAVRRKPYSVILVDEIEKAHPDVLNVFLQIMEDGRLTDAKGRVVDFKNTVIVMTTNIGQRLITSEYQVGFAPQKDVRQTTYEHMKDKVLEEMKKEFKPEFLNRIDEIIVFHPLTPEQIRLIVDIMLADIAKQVETSGMKLEVSDEVKNLLAQEGFDAKFGARPLRRAVQKFIENPLSTELLSKKFVSGDLIRAFLCDGKVAFEKKEGSGTEKKNNKKSAKKS